MSQSFTGLLFCLIPYIFLMEEVNRVVSAYLVELLLFMIRFEKRLCSWMDFIRQTISKRCLCLRNELEKAISLAWNPLIHFSYHSMQLAQNHLSAKYYLAGFLLDLFQNCFASFAKQTLTSIIVVYNHLETKGTSSWF